MPDEIPHQPHDKLFKTSFSEPQTAAAFLKAHLPPTLANAIDWHTLRVEPGSFIDEQLHGSESDLLYQLNLQQESALLYLLFEHQRREDPWLPFRLLRYIVRIWEKFRKEHPDARRLPPVIPVVLAQNAAPWPLSNHLHQLIATPEALADTLLPLTPGFAFQLVQLAELPFDKIVGTPLGIMTLRVLKAEQTQQLLADAVWDETQMLKLPQAALTTLLRYIYHAGDIDRDGFICKLNTLKASALRDNTMTLAEQFRQEGRLEGHQEGRQEGHQEGVWMGRVQMLEELLGHVPTPVAELERSTLVELQARFQILQDEYNRRKLKR